MAEPEIDWKDAIEAARFYGGRDSGLGNLGRAHLAMAELIGEMADLIEETIGCDETDEELQALLACARVMTERSEG